MLSVLKQSSNGVSYASSSIPYLVLNGPQWSDFHWSSIIEFKINMCVTSDGCYADTDLVIFNSSYDFSYNGEALLSSGHGLSIKSRDLEEISDFNFFNRHMLRQESILGLDNKFQHSGLFFQDLGNMGLHNVAEKLRHVSPVYKAFDSVHSRPDISMEPTSFHASCRDLNLPSLEIHLSGAKRESQDFVISVSNVRSEDASTTSSHPAPDQCQPQHASPFPNRHQKPLQSLPTDRCGSMMDHMPSAIPVEIQVLQDAHLSGQPIAIIASPKYLFDPCSLPSEYAYSFLGLFFLINITVSTIHSLGQ